MPTVIFPATHHPRRASDRTGARLGRALLAYLAAITLVITLAPFEFTSGIAHGLNLEFKPFDVGMNALMFAPLGFLYQLSRPRGARVHWWRVLLAGAGFSAVIETLQLLAPARYSSPWDLASNTLGAVLGAASLRLVSDALDGERTVRTLALELPLMGLVYLLVPMVWLTGLASTGTSRAWLILPIASAVGLILGTVHGAVLADRARRTSRWLWTACVVWFAVALLPGTIRDPALIATGLVLMVFIAHLRAIMAAGYHEHYNTRRFERPTLAAIAPLFVVFLIGVAGWPWHGISTQWPGVVALLPVETFSFESIYRPLEHVAAFTLVGYGLAEWDGRTVQGDGALAVRVAWRAGVLAAGLEVATAFLNGRPASALLAVLSTVAAAVGGGLYGLQRNHVRALISRGIRTMPDAPPAPVVRQTPPMGHQAVRPTPIEIAVVDMREEDLTAGP